ncbi:hypothetical protein C8R46DRAFT_1356504 [Mycena filopes]|nr:hypothetical protein C8R46DRAFT_1356504 [Mycena filopes]
MPTIHTFRTFTVTFALLAIQCVYGSPLPPSSVQGPLRFHILTTGEEGCSAAQVTFLKAGVTDARNLADVTMKVLKTTNAITSTNGFYWLFGGEGSVTTPADIIQRFKFVKNLQTPDEVTSLDAFQNSGTDVTFTCVPANAKKSGHAYANTVNIGRETKGSDGTPTVNLIRFTPHALANSDSFTQAAEKVEASGNITSAFTYDKKVPQPLAAFTLIHEVQHCDALLGDPLANHLADQKFNGTSATGLKAVQSLDPKLKKLNPQNYAWFALYAGTKPDVFSESCFISDPITARALDTSTVAVASSATSATCPGMELQGDIDFE